MSFNSFIQPSIVLQRFLIEGQGQCCCFRTTSQGMPISEYQGGLSTKNKSIQFGKVFFSFSDKLIFIILLRDLKLATTCYQNGESEKDKLRTIVKNTFFQLSPRRLLCKEFRDEKSVVLRMYHTYFFSSCPIRSLGRFTSYPGLGLADEITSSIIYHAFPYIEHISHKSRLNDKSILFLRCAPITITYLHYIRYSKVLT